MRGCSLSVSPPLGGGDEGVLVLRWRLQPIFLEGCRERCAAQIRCVPWVGIYACGDRIGCLRLGSSVRMMFCLASNRGPQRLA